MSFWGGGKTRAISFWRRWKDLFLVSSLAALLLYWAGFGWFVSVLIGFCGVYVARELGYEVIRSWVVPIAHPRIWTFKLEAAKSFVEKISVQLSEENKDVLRGILELAKFGSSDEWLEKLVV